MGIYDLIRRVGLEKSSWRIRETKGGLDLYMVRRLLTRASIERTSRYREPNYRNSDFK